VIARPARVDVPLGTSGARTFSAAFCDDSVSNCLVG
jgi:hypothetical protein